MSVRAKMVVSSVTHSHWMKDANGDATKVGVVKLTAQYDPECPEDVNFAIATPSGEISLNVNNPAAFKQFELGKTFYVDFNEVPE